MIVIGIWSLSNKLLFFYFYKMDEDTIIRSVAVGFGIAFILSMILFNIVDVNSKSDLLGSLFYVYVIFLGTSGFWLYLLEPDLEKLTRRIGRLTYLASGISGAFYIVFLLTQLLYTSTPPLFRYVMVIPLVINLFLWLFFFVFGYWYVVKIYRKRRKNGKKIQSEDGHR